MRAWWEQLRIARWDAVLAAVFTLVGLAQTLVWPIAAPGIGELYVLGSTLPLAWRRSYPVEAAVVSSAFWLIPLHGFPILGFIAVVLQFYALGRHGDARIGVGRHGDSRVALGQRSDSRVPLGQRSDSRVAIWAATAWGAATGVVGTLLGPELPVAAIGAVLVVVAPVVAGRIVAHQRAQNRALLQLAAELEAEKRKVMEAAVGEERARIAQELHDVLGHELTLIAVQAEAASTALRLAPERAVEPVEAIRETAHRTLREMRSALNLVSPPSEPAAAPPADATPAGLAELATRARAAGIPSRLEVTGAPWSEQTPVWFAMHRIVRECLTNAGRHAPGQPITVEIHWDHDTVTAVAANDTEAGRQPVAGRGLTGMRHRAELLGGDLAVNVDGGRFEVRATLPRGTR